MARNPQARTGLDTMLGASGSDTAAGADALIAAGTAPTASAQASAAGGDTIVAASGLAGAASALGLDPDVRVHDVDPGVGAHRLAVEAETIRSVSTEPDPRAPLDAAERAELEELRRLRAGLPSSRDELETLRQARPGALIAAAPADELRLATAATRVLRGGRTYPPHASVPLDLEGWAELREIGAITATAWERLPLADEA